MNTHHECEWRNVSHCQMELLRRKSQKIQAHKKSEQEKDNQLIAAWAFAVALGVLFLIGSIS